MSGLPRTGTFSTFTALERLLPGRCHHMARVIEVDRELYKYTSIISSGNLLKLILKFDALGAQ